MKYYVYISDAKVDMLLPQITQEQKKKLATEFKIDLKVLSASRKTETETSDNRMSRVEAVCEFIRQYGNLGTVDYPDEYIEDTIPMGLTVLDGACVFYGGFTPKTIFGLGGSLKHMIGSESASGVQDMGRMSMSQFGSLGRTLNEWLKKEEREAPGEDTDRDFNIVMEASFHMRERPHTYPQQRLQFLAKRLHQTTYAGVPEKIILAMKRRGYTDSQIRSQCRLEEVGKNLVLATPLYVAMAE